MDDDPIAIQLARRALADYQDVRFATRTHDAFRLMNERVPDLVVLDAEMPGESGFEFCTRLKAHPDFREIPVIFVTAHDDVAFEIRAIEGGAADFITKPISAPRIQLRVKLHLQLKAQLARLRELAATDALTGLANRRAFDETLTSECSRARRSGRPLSLLLSDVDHFKRFNDAHGHPEGDRCLQQVAAAVRSAGRRTADCAARLGGEEFALLLPDTPLPGANIVAGFARDALARKAIPHGDSPVAPHVTLSIGVSCLEPSEWSRTDEPGPRGRALLRAADRALYLAKERGRDRVEYAAMARTSERVDDEHAS